MLENLILQDSVAQRLRSEFLEKRLPSSILLHGPEHSGKMTAALEVARANSCKLLKAEWNCPCQACESHRRLLEPDLVLVGPRYFLREIAASAKGLMIAASGALEKATPLQYLYLRSVRKLLKRADRALWEGEETKLSKITNAVLDVEEALELIGPGKPLPESEALDKILTKVAAACAGIWSAIGTEHVSIGAVRHIEAWASLTPTGLRKTCVIENADRMQDGARNALLKLLEEPPETLSLILVTTRPGAMIPTVLSRLRQYRFADRGTERSAAVLQKIFRLPGDYSLSLEDFFRSFGANDPNRQKTQARALLASLASDARQSRKIAPQFEALAEGLDDEGRERFSEMKKEFESGQSDSSLASLRENLGGLIEVLQLELDGLLREEKQSARSLSTMETLAGILRESRERLAIWNQGPSLVLETLCLRIREAL